MKNRDYASHRAALLRQRAHNNNHPKAIAAIKTNEGQIKRLFVLTLLATLVLVASWTMARAQEIQKVVSASGIEAWLVEDHTVPIIAIDFSFAGGVSQDEDGKEGGVTMLTSLMDEGADDLSSEEFLTALEENAIKMKFDAGRDRFFGSLRTLTPNKALAFELLAKAIQSPHFEASSVERMRAQWIASVRRAEKDPNTILARTFREAAYPGHPYSRPSNGTATSLAAVTQADLKHLHKAIFTRDGLTIGIVGAIDAESVKTLLDQVFAPLPAKGDLKPVEDVKIARIGEIHVPFDAPQTSIRFGAPGIDRQDDDFYAAYLVNHILGGGSFSSRLYNEIREKRGLAYGVYSYLTSSDHAALFAGGMATRSENNEQAITLVKQEIARLGKEGPTQEELDATKKYLIGSYPLRFDSSSKISRQLVALQNEGLNIDYFEKRNSYIEAVTLEDTKRVAARLLDPSKLLLVTVGKQMKNASLAPKAPVSEDALAPSKTKPQTN